MHSETPPSLAAARPADLSDADFDELDDLLEQTPEPLEPLDVLMLEGYLCGTIVQPVLLEAADWLPFVFDVEGRALPDDAPVDWKGRTTALIVRRHAALRRSIAEDGSFEPILPDFDREPPPSGEDDPLAEVAPASRVLVPWTAGFAHALDAFPALVESDDAAVMMAVSRVLRHLPPETDDDREIVATLDRELPLRDADEAIGELIESIAELHELTREQRFRVETVRRATPKVGRNDPCPCGSGKKFKQCHGRS